MRRTLIIGATSAIAEATARLFAGAGDSLYLVARDAMKLEAIGADLRVRGAMAVHTELLDVLDYDRHAAVIDSAIATLKGLDFVLIAHGTLPDQKACEDSADVAREAFELNALSTISLLTHLANYFGELGRGTIAVISSVAGDRGRQSNYVYGSAKGAVTIFLQGLRNRLYASGVRVLTIKPGLVDTPMTKDFEKGILWSTPDRIATEIYRKSRKGPDVIYAPPFWRWVMVGIRLVPEWLFKRTSL